jgi:hypothetical protein
MDHLLQQQLIDLHALSETGEFKAHLQTIARTMGFERIFYISARLIPASLPGPGGFAETPLILCDYPQDWIAHYQGRQLARIDPVIAACNTTRQPLSWDVRNFFAQGRRARGRRGGASAAVRCHRRRYRPRRVGADLRRQRRIRHGHLRRWPGCLVAAARR